MEKKSGFIDSEPRLIALYDYDKCESKRCLVPFQSGRSYKCVDKDFMKKNKK